MIRVPHLIEYLKNNFKPLKTMVQHALAIEGIYKNILR